VDVAQPFGVTLRRHRRAKGLTQEALGELADLSTQAIGALERGDRRFPRQDTVLRLADALGLTGEERTAFAATAQSRKGQLADEPDLPVAPISQLPADLPDFTGRDGQIDRLTASLRARQPGSPPIVVLVGGPGIGKSALALHVAHRIAGDFPDGQLYLDLAGTSGQPRDPAVMLGELLYALGVVGGALPDGIPARAALFRSLLADRRMLLVCDDAAHSDQVRPLLPTGGCAVLVTSRQLLTDLAGARHVELDVLPEAEARRLFAGIVGPDRVAQEPEHTTAILAACAHLPLAIRIAAGKLAGRPAWPLRLMHERLADESRRLNELQLGELGVRASFEASMDNLPADAIRAFRLLALLGPRTVPGWVLGPLLDRPEADDTLDTLVDANLLSFTGIDTNGRPRYRLHDLLRAYADEGLDTIPLDERRAAVRRLLTAWLDLTVRATHRLEPSLFRSPLPLPAQPPIAKSTVDTLLREPGRWFDAEHATLIAAVELAAGWDEDELAWQLSVAAVPYYDQHSFYEDWRRTHELALQPVRNKKNLRGEAALLRGLGQILLYCDVYDQSAADFRRALELARECGDNREAFLATGGLATIDRVLGHYDKAEKHIRSALDIAAAGDDRGLEAQMRNSLGMVLLAQDNFAESRQNFLAALDICRTAGDSHREAVVLREASQLFDRIGETDQAVAFLDQAMDIFQKMDDDRCVAFTRLRAGRVHTRHANRGPAVAALETAAAYFAQHGNRMEEAECWQLLGELDARLGDAANARTKLGRSLRLWQSIGGADEHIANVSSALAAL
jgi:tetratricopeptide (TPR) repeat protein/transcriptional regulator with XRE-family HTH domain